MDDRNALDRRGFLERSLASAGASAVLIPDAQAAEPQAEVGACQSAL